MCELVRVLKLQSVFHYHDIHRASTFSFNGVDSKNLCEQTIFVRFVVFCELVQQFQVQIKFSLAHSLNDKLAIVGKEKE